MEFRIIGKAYGQDVKAYTLQDDKIKVEIMTLGATIVSLKTLDLNGQEKDVVLGYNTTDEYLANGGYLGATIGRIGNRIGGAKFTLNGKEYNVGANDNGNSLHGGIKGFDKKIWADKVVGDVLELSCVSPDGEEGFPATLNVTVRFSVKDGGLKLDYQAQADDDTVVNLTNHVYFNLSGEGNGDILDTVLFLDADAITPVDGALIPHGTLMPVVNTPFDFRTPKAIGEGVSADHEQIKLCNGYDINYALNGKGFRKIATAQSPKTGIKMEVYTDNNGVQVYSGNFLSGVMGKSNKPYDFRNGFCLETQNYPNAVNCPEYPSSTLKKGEIYKTTTVYKFGL